MQLDKKMLFKIGGGVLSLVIAVGAYVTFKPNLDPNVLKEEAEKNIQNTKNTFSQAGNAF